MKKIKYKAIQYDVSRGRIPKLDTVKERIEFLKPYGLNMLCFYIESPFECNTFPGVGCGKTPITKSYLKKLQEICQEQNILFTPIIQILGHQEKLLSLEDWQHLGEIPPHDKHINGNNFMPCSDEVKTTLFAWLDEILPFTNSPFVHVGCDEIWSFGKGRCSEIIKRKGPERVFADYLIAFYEFLRTRGKQLVFWGDFIVDYPKTLELIPKDIIIANWGYGTYKETFEHENHHFAAHSHLASRGHQMWVCGNNMAEYICTPFQRLEENTRIWIELGNNYGANAFLITDWGSYDNVNSYSLSLLGDMYILLRLKSPKLTQKQFLEKLSEKVLGYKNTQFIEGMTLMLNTQGNSAYFPERSINFCPILPGIMLDNPASQCGTSRRFGCYYKKGLDLFLRDMQKAHTLMQNINISETAYPEITEDFIMLSNRMTAVALRAQLWYDYVWDTSYRWPDSQYLKACKKRANIREEYTSRAEADIQWHKRRWHQDSLITEWHKCSKRLSTAINTIHKIISKDGTLT